MSISMLVDTHCHLDAAVFDADRDAVVEATQNAGVAALVVPAVERANFDAVLALGRRYPCCVPALGIHPMYVENSSPEDLGILRQLLAIGRPAAVGEIGLDFFADGFDVARQEWFFAEQLKLAREFDLPVLLHVRRAQDAVLKHLRRIRVRGGIAHAFNGSRQQAEEFIKLGFKLGFGGAMTYPPALRIRELAASLPINALVLETDAPDIPPEWVGKSGRNSPQQLPRIAQVLAELRRVKMAELIEATTQNAIELMPQLAQLCTRPQVIH
jgi:TatD DNase family protein